MVQRIAVHTAEEPVTFKHWLPYIFQALVVMGAAYTYTTGMEHRLTVLEEALKSDQSIIVKQQEQITKLQETQQRLIALEEFVHASRR